jgi:hypothetical protein
LLRSCQDSKPKDIIKYINYPLFSIPYSLSPIPYSPPPTNDKLWEIEANQPTMSDTFINPALKQQPRYEPAPVIAVQRNTSILEWLEAQGRLIERDDRDPAVSTLDQPNLDDELFEEDRGYQEEEDSEDADDAEEA